MDQSALGPAPALPGVARRPAAPAPSAPTRRLLVGGLLLALGLGVAGLAAPPTSAHEAPAPSWHDMGTPTPTPVRPSAGSGGMSGMSMDSPPPTAIPAKSGMDSMSGMDAPTAIPYTKQDGMVTMSGMGNSAAPAAPAPSNSHQETVGPDAGTKGIVLGTLGILNTGVILTAAVLKRRQPQKSARRPNAANSSVGDL